MFNNNRIKKEVMKVVNSRIADAQVEYDSTVMELENTHLQAVEDLKTKLESDKDVVATKLVNSILGGTGLSKDN